MTITNHNPPMVVAAPQLPPPRLKGSPYPSAAAVSAVVGSELAEPIIVLEHAISEAERALTELHDCRPGIAGPDGRKWLDALASDAEAAENSERPRKWRIELLLAGEQHRWAEASALTAAVALLFKRTEGVLDRNRIAAAASVKTAAAQKTWAEAGRDGWNAHLADPVAAQRCYRVGVEALAGFRDASGIGRWARREAEPARRPRDEYPPDVLSLPPDLEARGRWLLLQWTLHPSRWLRLPGDDEAIFPRGSDELILDKALGENTERYTALRDGGVYSSKG